MIEHSENLETGTENLQPQALQKRTYAPRDKKSPSIASFNEQIKKKRLQQEALQADIDVLTAKRNSLFVTESEMLGLMDVMADPEGVAWLAKQVKESNRQ